MDETTKDNLRKLAELSANETIYVVGGTLRDFFLGNQPADMDFAVQDAPRVTKRFAAYINSRPIPLHETPGRETLRVATHPNVFFDFSEMQGTGIEEDLSKRDFTINAMAVPLREYIKPGWKPIDMFKGCADLEKKVVRVLPGSIFDEDPLRILRAFRLSATLGFDIEENTLREIAEKHTGLNSIAAERICTELDLLLSVKQVFPLVRLMSRTGVLSSLFPEVFSQDYSPTSTAEILDTFQSLEQIISQPAIIFPGNLPEIHEIYSGRDSTRLKLSALLYPVGRKNKKREGSTVETILKPLRFNNKDIDFVAKVVELQKIALFSEFNLEGLSENPSRVYTFVKNCGGQLIPVLLLAGARILKSDQKAVSSFVQSVHHLMDFYQQRFLPAQNQPTLLTGDDLIQKFKLSPSPVFKNILDRVEEARVLGFISTRSEAETLARNLIQTLA